MDPPMCQLYHLDSWNLRISRLCDIRVFRSELALSECKLRVKQDLFLKGLANRHNENPKLLYEFLQIVR
jgi:hypothetical protein